VRNIHSIEPALLNMQIDAEAKNRWRPSVDLLGMTPREAWTEYVNERLGIKDDADNTSRSAVGSIVAPHP